MVYAPDLVPEDPMAALTRRMEKLERLYEQLGSADVLATAGIRTEPGKFIILGDLEVPNGKIKNDWLESPIEIGRGAANADGFTPDVTQVDFAAFTIPIPAGYTRALVKAESMTFVYNSTGVGDYLYSRIFVDSPTESTWSRELLGDLNPTSGCSLTVTKQTLFEGLTTGDITVRQAIHTAFAPIAHAANGTTVTAAVWFLR